VTHTVVRGVVAAEHGAVVGTPQGRDVRVG